MFKKKKKPVTSKVYVRFAIVVGRYSFLYLDEDQKINLKARIKAPAREGKKGNCEIITSEKLGKPDLSVTV